MKRSPDPEITLSVIAAGLCVAEILLSSGWLPFVAAVLILIGIVSPALSVFIRDGWMKVGEILGSISSAIILSLIYFLAFAPLSLFRKRSQSQYRKNPGTVSMYRERNHVFRKTDLEDLW